MHYQKKKQLNAQKFWRTPNSKSVCLLSEKELNVLHPNGNEAFSNITLFTNDSTCHFSYTLVFSMHGK